MKRLLSPHSLNEPVLTIDREHIHLNGDVTSDALFFIAEVRRAMDETNEQQKNGMVEKILNQLHSAEYLTAVSDD